MLLSKPKFGMLIRESYELPNSSRVPRFVNFLVVKISGNRACPQGEHHEVVPSGRPASD